MKKSNYGNKSWIWIVVGAVVVMLLMIIVIIVSFYNYANSNTEEVATSSDATITTFLYNDVPCDFLNLTYADLEEMGFTTNEDADEKIAEGECNTGFQMYSDDGEIYVRFKNFDNEGAKAVKECNVCFLSFDSSNGDYNIALLNDITWETSSDETVDIMGEPDSTFNGVNSDNNQFTIYTFDDYQGANVSMYFDDNGLYYIEFTNLE